MPLLVAIAIWIGVQLNLPGIIIVGMVLAAAFLSLAAVVRAALRDSRYAMQEYQARKDLSSFNPEEDER
ncbi:MAG: hypothetical protein GYB64_18470 [Chloroflexi bacterium]|nr:hypothetical protein [Chloroflexota bacterium]